MSSYSKLIQNVTCSVHVATTNGQLKSTVNSSIKQDAIRSVKVTGTMRRPRKKSFVECEAGAMIDHGLPSPASFEDLQVRSGGSNQFAIHSTSIELSEKSKPTIKNNLFLAKFTLHSAIYPRCFGTHSENDTCSLEGTERSRVSSASSHDDDSLREEYDAENRMPESSKCKFEFEDK